MIRKYPPRWITIFIIANRICVNPTSLNLAALRPSLLAQAMVDAKARGISMTKAVGSSLGSVIAVSSGPVQVTSPDSVDASAGGMYDTTTIPKTVTVTVSVSFKVK